MTKIKIEDDFAIRVKGYDDSEGYLTVSVVDSARVLGLASDVTVWFDVDEARELVKALKKHIKKAEGN